MEDIIFWMLITIAAAVLIIAVASMIFLRKKKKRPIDYYSFFIIGICWIPLGLAIKNHFMWIIGLVFMAVGLVNKDKWKTNKRKWSKLDRNEKILVSLISILLGVLVAVGFIFLFLAK